MPAALGQRWPPSLDAVREFEREGLKKRTELSEYSALETQSSAYSASPAPRSPLPAPCSDFTPALLRILGSLNVCSKEWIIRQYDHEVQGGSVIKPLVGVVNDGPSDAAVLRPVLTSRRGIVVACGMNPCYGDLDPYWMAAAAIDEAVRNCVAVGADPQRIAILDNFCWGNTDRPETLGSLVRAALACYDVATVLGTPFISGKDSLNNEFRPQGGAEPIAIPPSLLISAIGQVDDVARCVTMDLKEPGNVLYLVGMTRDELGGSHFSRLSAPGDRQLSGRPGSPTRSPHRKKDLCRDAPRDPCRTGPRLSRPERRRPGGGRGRDGLCRRVRRGHRFARPAVRRLTPF